MMVELNTVVGVKTGELSGVEVGIKITEETAAGAVKEFHTLVKDLEKQAS